MMHLSSSGVLLPINRFVHDAHPALVKRHCHARRAFSTRDDVDAHLDVAFVVVAEILRPAVGFVKVMVSITDVVKVRPLT